MAAGPRIAALAAAVLALAAGCARGGDERVTILVPGPDKVIYLPITLADRLGYFRDEGLDVEIVAAPADSETSAGLLAGGAEVAVGFYNHAIDLQTRGRYVESIVVFGQAPGEVEVVATRAADRITSPADFAGRALGVTGLGSSTDLMTRYLASRHGVRGGDLTIVPVGAGDSLIAALRAGAIDAAMTTDPTAARLVQSGDARVLLDLRQPAVARELFGGPFPAACLYVESAWLEHHAVVARKLVRALVRALRFIATHSAAEIAARMPPSYHAGDRAMYVAALAASKAMFTSDGRMPPGGPETVHRMLAAVSDRIRDRPVDLAKTYTNAFVDAAQ